MILSDVEIRMCRGQELTIEPWDDDRLQPSSYDMELSEYLWVADHGRLSEIDLANPPIRSLGRVVNFTHYVLHPGEFVLGTTQEFISVGQSLVARLEGKSSLGRLGLVVHATAGYIDPGFRGHLTLELQNVAKIPIVLHPGIPIAQLTFQRMARPCERPYGSSHLGSRYQDQGIKPEPFKPRRRES